MRYLIPLGGGQDVTIEGPFPLSQHDWGQFMTVLEAMKPGLVATPEPAPSFPEETS